MHVVCLSAFAYRLVGKKEYAHKDMTRNGEWPWLGRVRPRPERQAAVMGLGAFSGYHRLPQLKHTY